MGLNRLTVEQAKPGVRDVYLRDEAIKNFVMKTTPKGKKVFFFIYRLPGGKQRWHRIGPYPDWSPIQARAEALRLRGQVAHGEDPGEVQEAAGGAALLFGDLLDRFLAEHGAKIKASTAESYRKVLTLIPQTMRAKPVAEVTGADIEKLHRDIGGRAPYRANAMLRVLSKFFNRHWPDNPEKNPTRKIVHFEEHEHERLLSKNELPSLGTVLNKMEPESPFAVAVILLLMLTGARRSEILTLKWPMVDFDRSCLLLPDSKTGKKTIFLDDNAIQIFHSLPKVQGNPYCFPGLKLGRCISGSGLWIVWRRILGMAGIDVSVRLHDLRHNWASMAVANGESLYVVGKALGHTKPSTTQRYAHLADDPLRRSVANTGALIAAAMASKTPMEPRPETPTT